MDNKSPSNFNQAFWLALSQLSSIAIGFVSAAILARYFSKDDYGTYKQVIYVYTTLSSLFVIGLPSVFSYFIPRLNAGEQKSLIKGVNRLFLLLGLCFSLTLFLSAGVIADLLKNPNLELAIRIFSPFPLFTLPTLGVEGIYTALKKTKFIAIYTLLSRTLSLIFIVFPVIIWNLSYIGAIIGWGIANFLIFLMSVYMKSRPYVGIKPELISNMYKTIFDYSLPLVGAFIAGFGISSASQFFISRYYGTSTFADFSNGNFSIPLAAMVASSVKQVLLPVISKAHKDGDFNQIRQVYGNACSNSILIIFPILVFAMIFAGPLMTFIYGEKYITSAPFLRAYLLRDFCSALPYFSVLLAFGKSRIYMNVHIIGVFYVWLTDYICVVLLSLKPESVVYCDSLFHIFCSAIIFVYIHKKYQLNLFTTKLVKNIFIVLVHCVSVGVFCTIFIKYIENFISFIQIPVWNLLLGAIIFSLLLISSGRLLHINYLSIATRFRRHG